MKKKIVLFLALMLALTTVLAEGQQGKVQEAQDSGKGQNATAAPQQGVIVQTRIETQTQAGDGEGEQIRERNRERLETGLQNALTRVTNENARQRLQQNIERFQQKYMERMQRMEGVEIEDVDNETGAVTVRAREEVRFLGFIKGKATKRFEIDDKGNVNERAPWYRFLYREVQQE